MAKLIINCETGETVEREFNKTEKDQEKLDNEIAKAAQILAQSKATAKAEILDRIGLTADELKTILG
jgi:hypothetical protein